MINIGILGSQSSHAAAFAMCCNIPDENGKFLIEDCRVNAICGYDDNTEHLTLTAERGKIPEIVETPADLLQKCDAVMLLKRTGETRIEDAIPFIERGIPVFLDKPVCKTNDDINVLKDILSKHKCVVAGGSGLKVCSDVLKVKEIVESGCFGKINGISINHCADMNSPFDGIAFYACHAIEIMLSIMGYNIASVNTSVLDEKNFSVYACYEDKFANLIFADNYNQIYVTVYGEKMNKSFTISLDDMYRNILLDFAGKIQKKCYLDDVEKLTKHVLLIETIEKSIKEERKIFLNNK